MNAKNSKGVLDNEGFDIARYLHSEQDYNEDRQDEKLEAYKLEGEISALRDWMRMHGLPLFGNLMPGLTINDTKETVKSFNALLYKRKEDMEFKTSIRGTMLKCDKDIANLTQENEKLKEK